MKRFLEDELTLSDVKSLAKKMKKKNYGLLIFLTIVGSAALVAAIAFVVIKLKERCCCDCDDFDDDDFDDDDDDDDDFECDECEQDENGCQYANDKDFEEN